MEIDYNLKKAKTFQVISVLRQIIEVYRSYSRGLIFFKLPGGVEILLVT